jgi:apolipoprotein N-acyltransferase
VRPDRRTLEQALLAALGCLLYLVPSLDRDYAPVALVALAPWSLLLADRRYPRPLPWILVGYYLTIPPSYRYLFGYGAPLPFLLPLLMLPIFVIFPLSLQWIARRSRLPLALVVPVTWVATEFALTRLVLGRMAFYMLGYQLAPFRYLIQTADLAGFYAASFLAAAVSGALADGVLALRDRRRTRRALVGAGLALGLALGSTLYSFRRLRGLSFEQGPTVAVVQPNLSRSTATVLPAMLRQLLLTLREVPPGAAQLVIWPENSIMDTIDRPDKYLVDLGFLNRTLKADLLVGALGAAPDDLTRSMNSAYLVRDGQAVARYDKNLLTVWGEYIPFQRALGRLHPHLPVWHRLLTTRLLGYTPNGVPGHEQALFHTAGLRVAPLICFESTVSSLVRRAARAGAQVIVNITSEGRVGALVQDQLLGISIFRAIETRRTLVRAGNAGVSALIAPDGRAYALLRGLKTGAPVDEEGVLIARLVINADDRPTLYTRVGDVFAWANLIGLVLLLVTSRLRPAPP